MAVNPIKVWNGTAWEYTGPVVAAPPVKYQATAPTSPATGDVWVESDYDVASVDPSKLLTGGVYTNESTRSAAIPTPTTGMVTYVGDTGTESPSSTIPQLEAYTGSAWQTPYGLTLIARQDFTGASSVAFNNIFTSTYKTYLFSFNISEKSSGGSTLSLRWRAGGTDNTSANYYYGSVGAIYSGGLNYGPLGGGLSTSAISTNARPYGNLFINTAQSSPKISGTMSDDSNYVSYVYGSGFNASYAADGFNILISAGTINGSIKIYGLRDA
jgi:hypothetical protein